MKRLRCPTCKTYLNSYMIKKKKNNVVKWIPVRKDERHCEPCNKIVRLEDSVIRVGKQLVYYETKGRDEND